MRPTPIARWRRAPEPLDAGTRTEGFDQTGTRQRLRARRRTSLAVEKFGLVGLGVDRHGVGSRPEKSSTGRRPPMHTAQWSDAVASSVCGNLQKHKRTSASGFRDWSSPRRSNSSQCSHGLRTSYPNRLRDGAGWDDTNLSGWRLKHASLELAPASMAPWVSAKHLMAESGRNPPAQAG